MDATWLRTSAVHSAAVMKARYWLTASSCMRRRTRSPSARSTSGSWGALRVSGGTRRRAERARALFSRSSE